MPRHLGNSRRLAAHLGLVIPPGAVLNVGSARNLRWAPGQALVWDDACQQSISTTTNSEEGTNLKLAMPYIVLRTRMSMTHAMLAKASMCKMSGPQGYVSSSNGAGTRYILQSFFCHPCEQRDLYKGLVQDSPFLQYRQTLREALLLRKCSRWLPMPPATLQTPFEQRLGALTLA